MYAYNYLSWFQKSTHGMSISELGAPGSCGRNMDSRRKEPARLPGHPLRQAKANLNDNLYLQATGACK